ncbi:MAG TPA: hypothetical protein VM911_12765 [Pyrinomonadaceae bacterium]|nr:hypothetical protein [Pyrinomonadaceae bacterium]
MTGKGFDGHNPKLKLDFNFAPFPCGEVDHPIIPRASRGTKVLQSGHSTRVQILESPADDQRIEVYLEQTPEGTQRVVLRSSTWTEGLGWCSQKTIRLDTEQLDDLHRALTVARHRVNLARAERGQTIESAQVIQLPTLA